MSERQPLSTEPFGDESLTSYLRRTARHQFFADPIAFLRAGGIEWHDRSRDPDLLAGALLEPLADFFGLGHDAVLRLTLQPYLRYLAEDVRGSMRRWTGLAVRTRLCDRCVAERPFGRIHWRFPIVTECLIHRRPLLDECRVCGAVRDRGSRRWARFDCGHHVQRSAGADSLSIDLRIQQAIQASVGLAHPQSPGAWLIEAAVSVRPRPLDVQSVRQSLRELWVEHRRARLAWRGPTQVLQLLEQRGARMYPTRREPTAAAPSVEGLRDIASQFRLQMEESSSSLPLTPIATMSSPALIESIAV